MLCPPLQRSPGLCHRGGNRCLRRACVRNTPGPGAVGGNVSVEGDVGGSIQGGHRILPVALIHSSVRWENFACQEPKGQGMMGTTLFSLSRWFFGLLGSCNDGQREGRS